MKLESAPRGKSWNFESTTYEWIVAQRTFYLEDEKRRGKKIRIEHVQVLIGPPLQEMAWVLFDKRIAVYNIYNLKFCYTRSVLICVIPFRACELLTIAFVEFPRQDHLFRWVLPPAKPRFESTPGFGGNKN